MKQIFSNLTVRLVLGVAAGIFLGSFASEKVITAVVPVKYILGQIIFFMVPLIILGFVAPSITKLKSNASRLLTLALVLAYFSSVGSAVFAMLLGYELIPAFQVASVTEGVRSVPGLFFQLDIPAIMPVMSALFLSLTLGLAVIWTKAELF